MRRLARPLLATRRRIALASAAGAVVVAVVLAAGYAGTHPQRWQAESRVAVFPAEPDAAVRASYYETLGNGQIVATLADILEAHLGAADLGELDVRVIPNTAVLAIRATADDGEAAETAAEDALASSVAHVATLRIPFTVATVQHAGGTAARAGIGPTTLLAVAAVAGAAIGLGAANAVLALRAAVEEPEARVTPIDEQLARAKTLVEAHRATSARG